MFAPRLVEPLLPDLSIVFCKKNREREERREKRGGERETSKDKACEVFGGKKQREEKQTISFLGRKKTREKNSKKKKKTHQGQRLAHRVPRGHAPRVVV